VLLLCACLIGPAASAANDRYDPRLRFRTISTPRFDIHYHQGEEADARRLAAIAESVASTLDASLGPATGRVQVVLVAQSDLSNGWATPLPYNTIELTVAAPAGASTLGNTDDWLRMVFTHEYTHIVHLGRGRGWIGGLRRVFGRLPALYPNLFVPDWQIEGLATFQESAVTGGGRVRDSSFRALVEVAAARSRFEPLDRSGGGLVDWPGGQTPYAYGALFHEYLAERYGEASLARLTDATAERIPFLGAPAFRKVFGRPLGDLWREFEAASSGAAGEFGPGVRRLTAHGFSVRGPRFDREGTLFYSLADPHAFPSLRALSPTGESKHVANRFLGDRIAIAGDRLIFDQAEVRAQVALQSDLYSVGVDGAHPRRLTAGARAADPDVSREGVVAYTVQHADRRTIAISSVGPDGTMSPADAILDEGGVSYAAPRWSPDGRFVLAERGTRELVLVDVQARRRAGTVARFARGRAVSGVWLSNDAVVFASDHEGRGFRLYRTELSTGRLSRLEGTGPDATSPAVSPDGRTLAFVGYTPDGYDLFSVQLDAAFWTDVATETLKAPPAETSSQTGPEQTPRGYSPWKTIAPRFWTPTITIDGDEVVVGAATASSDVLGRHAYTAGAGWSPTRGRPDWQAAYVYDRWRPSFFVSAADDTDSWRDGDVRTREGNAGVVVPFRRVRWTQSVLGAFHASTDSFACSGCPVEDVRRRSVRGGWRVNAARGYGYSISLEEGWSLDATAEATRTALGADGDAGAATVDARGYVGLFPRHGVLAVRAAAAATWGDAAVRRIFSASGSASQPGGPRFGRDAIGLLRGVDDDEVIGRQAVVANADYRFPIRRIDRGIGTLPFFARVVHAAVFIDVGNAWTAPTRFEREDILVSTGLEASLDAVIGYKLPLTVAGGAAWVSGGRGLAVFGRIGRAF
jgi:hypothetical protein